MEVTSTSSSPARIGAASDPERAPAPAPAPVPPPSTTGRTPWVSTDTATASPQSQQTIHDGNKNNDRNNHNNNHNNINNNNRNCTRGNGNSNSNKRRRRARQQQNQQQNQDEATKPPVCSVCQIVKDDGPPKYKCPKCRATYCGVACCREHKTACPGTTTDGRAAAGSATAAESATANPSLDPSENPSRGGDDGGGGGDDDESSDCGDETDDDDDDDSSLEDGWKITDDMRTALRNSIWLRNELGDGGLRDMIASVVRSEKKYKSYHKRQNRQGRQRVPRHGRQSHHHGGGHHRFRSKRGPPPHPHDALAEKRSRHRDFDVFADKLLVLADVLERREPPATDAARAEFGLGSGLDGRPSGAGPGRAPSHRNERELEEWLHRKWDPSVPPPALALKSMRKAIPKFRPIDVSSSSSSEDEDASMNGDEPEGS